MDDLRDAYENSARGEFDCDEDFDDDAPRDCYRCGGDGYVEGDTFGWDEGDIVPCKSCGGSGDAKDMTIW